MDEVVVEYQLTWGEWRRFYWGATAKKIFAAFIAFFVFFFAVSALVFTGQSRTWAIVVSIFGIGYVISNFWIAPRRYWNSAVGVQEAKRVAISDEGMLSTSESLEEQIGWDRFRSLKDVSRYFILVGRPGYASVFIPKRGCTSTEDEDELLRLVLRHIPYS